MALSNNPQAIAPTPMSAPNTLGAYALSQNAAEQNYQAQLAQQNAMWGGLAGLGSAGISVAPKLYSALNPATQAAAAAAPSVASGLAAAAPAAYNGIGSVADAAAAVPSVASDIAADTAPAVADAAGAGATGLDAFLAALPALFSFV
jgi:hypothetical protein